MLFHFILLYLVLLHTCFSVLFPVKKLKSQLVNVTRVEGRSID